MKRDDQSSLRYLLESRPLVLKRNGIHVCLHDAFSGEVLGGQTRVEMIQEAGSITVLRVDFALDGRYVRIDGE
jgi:hypothetical protein